eukprot:200453-Pelagomonas_calceolata.AAC.3
MNTSQQETTVHPSQATTLCKQVYRSWCRLVAEGHISHILFLKKPPGIALPGALHAPGLPVHIRFAGMVETRMIEQQLNLQT